MRIVMYPWLAFGHMTPFLHLSNKLAEKGHTITFLVPKKALTQLHPLNLHPHLISFQTISVPHVDGLPLGAETNSDVPFSLLHLLNVAMERTSPEVERIIHMVEPDLVFYDSAHWLPAIARSVGAKAVCFIIIGASAAAFGLVPGAAREVTDETLPEELVRPPPGYPSSKVVLRANEARSIEFIWKQHEGEEITFFKRIVGAISNCDAIAMRTCWEMEGRFCEYMRDQYSKQVYLTGPVLPEPEPHQTALERRWADWLNTFEPGSVVFCAFGSQPVVDKLEQFQELCIGLELTGLPFLVVLKPPAGFSTVEEALPDGFQERVKGRGVVYGGWVQQPLILAHPSVGCFVSHCGFGSMWESLMSDCRIALVPHLGEQILNARLMTEEMGVAVEVKREENGWFSRDSLKNAVKSVMDDDVVRENHKKWRDVLGDSRFAESYVSRFEQNLLELVR